MFALVIVVGAIGIIAPFAVIARDSLLHGIAGRSFDAEVPFPSGLVAGFREAMIDLEIDRQYELLVARSDALTGVR